METERFNAAALYGLAGSDAGICGLLAAGQDGGRGSMRGKEIQLLHCICRATADVIARF